MMPNPECMEAGMPVYQYEDSTGMAVCGAECLPNSHWNFTWNACSWNDYCEGEWYECNCSGSMEEMDGWCKCSGDHVWSKDDYACKPRAYCPTTDDWFLSEDETVCL